MSEAAPWLGSGSQSFLGFSVSVRSLQRKRGLLLVQIPHYIRCLKHSASWEANRFHSHRLARSCLEAETARVYDVW